ncbi:MAG: hypothetical protein H6657_09240 [Ardenticatenaceae bacterium]|nr:hypothetical protein [Ardenticatenaceae bacterium]
MSKFSQFFRRPSLWLVFFLLFFLLLLVITANFTPNPWQLTPVGLLVVVLSGLTLLFLLYRLLSSRFFAVLAAVVFTTGFGLSSPVAAADDTAMPPTSTLSYYTDWSAWQAAMDIDINAGWVGIAPLFHRPLIPNQPVTMITFHDLATNTLQPYSIYNGYQQFPLGTAPAILQTIPEHTLPIGAISIMTSADPSVLSQTLLPALQASCFTCTGSFDYAIHPMYATKLVMDGTVFIVGQVDNGSFGQIVSAVNDFLSPYLESPWNLQWRTTQLGNSFMAGSQFEWFVDTSYVYSGSVLDGSFSLQTARTMQLTQVYGGIPDINKISAMPPGMTFGVESIPLLPTFPETPNIIAPPIIGDPIWEGPDLPIPPGPTFPNGPDIPDFPDGLPDLPVVPGISPIPEIPVFPEILPVPEMPSIPEFGTFPDIPSPGIPIMPDVPSLPSLDFSTP